MEKVRAILEINGKEQAFAKSANTPQQLATLLKNEGISLKAVKRFETYTSMQETTRGRSKRKY